MKKFIVTITAAVLFTATMAQTQNVQVKAHKRDAVRGANPNIHMDVPTKDIEAPKPSGYKAPEMQRGANMQVLNRSKHEIVRGANPKVIQDEPTRDIEVARPSYNNPKQVSVKHNQTNKMRGADANIRTEEPVVDQEMARPAGYQAPSNKGRTVVMVPRKTVEKTRGTNPHILKDVPTVDVEQPRMVK